MRSKNLGGEQKKRNQIKMTGFKFNCPSLEDSEEEGGAMEPSGYLRRRR
jgi:hypothetical protein